MTCKCGYQNRSGAITCRACGRSLVNKRSKLPVILLIIALVIAVAALIYFLIPKNSEPKAGPKPTQPPVSIGTNTPATSHQHTWQAATCTLPKRCTGCGQTEGDPLQHSFSPATPYAPSTCAYCGATIGTPLVTSSPTIAAGSYHTLYLRDDGTVVATGKESLDGEENRGSRMDIFDWENIVAISASSHSVGVKADGTVLAVGVNTHGQCNVDSWTDIVAADAGELHTLGLRSDGTVVATGNNEFGQCNVSSWKNVVQVACGHKTSYALTSDGRVLSAGEERFGSGWAKITSISAGPYHLVGLKEDGTVVSDGRFVNWDSGTTYWTDIVAITTGSAHTVGLKSDGTIVGCGNIKYDYGQWRSYNWSDVVQITAGMYHTVGMKSDGTLVAIGNNYQKQCDIVNYS